jgi:hypothetical protein
MVNSVPSMVCPTMARSLAWICGDAGDAADPVASTTTSVVRIDVRIMSSPALADRRTAYRFSSRQHPEKRKDHHVR